MKKVMIFVFILLFAGVIIFSASYFGKNSDSGLTGDTVLNTSDNTSTTDNGISESELSKHDIEENCWVGFQGKVYDLTSWLQKHPSGVNAILPTCGTSKEFEDAFTKKHGTTKVAIFMKVAELIGTLKYQGQLQ